MMLKFLTA